MARTPRTEWHCPFTIYVDDREIMGGHPFTFQGFVSDAKEGRLPVVVKTEVIRLRTGDYSIVGLQDQITVERKAPEDLIKTLTQRRDNFFDELERMRAFEQAVIVVEAGWDKVCDLIPQISQANPKSVIRTILAIQQDFNTVQWAFMPDREWAHRYTFQFLKRYYQRLQRKQNNEAVPVGQLCEEA